jgi:hypothetical protein
LGYKKLKNYARSKPISQLKKADDKND